MAQPSEKFRALFSEPTYLCVGTIKSDGSPGVAPVWTDVQDGGTRFDEYTGRTPYPWRGPNARRVTVVVEPERVDER